MHNKSLYLINGMKTKSRGFTLIELLVVVGIIAITMGIGLPGFQSTIASSRLTSSANNMLTAIRLARSESIKNNMLAGLVINTSTGTWTVFRNTTANTIQEYALDSGISLTIAAPTTGGTTPTYRPDGRVSDAKNYVFQFSSFGTNETRILNLQPSGRVSICTPVLPGPDTECRT